MTRREAAKGVPGPIFLPRGFVGLVLFPPASLRLSPHLPPTLCLFDDWSHCPYFSLISPLHPSLISPPVSSDR
jgi:hypothetical protein